MSTEAQIAANQENGKLSQGPSSPEGLARSSKNAIKHGLTGRTVHLAESEKDFYKAFGEGIFAGFDPKGTDEAYLVEAIINTRWRLSQITQIESGLFAVGELENKDLLANYPAERIQDVCRALTFSRKQKEFEKLNRYQSRLERQAATELKRLEDLQALRKAKELKELQEAASLIIKASLEDNHAFDLQKEFGFVWSTDQMCDIYIKAKARAEAHTAYPTAHLFTTKDIPTKTS